MSSSEEENFDMDVSGSDSEQDFVPKKKVCGILSLTCLNVHNFRLDYRETKGYHQGCAESSSKVKDHSRQT